MNDYTFIGWAKGKFENDKGEKTPYFHIFVTTPVSGFKSDDYEACGLKAEKLKAAGPEVWDGIPFGSRVQLFFDSRKTVMFIRPIS